MRHLKKTVKLGRTSEHRNRMLGNLVCSLIKKRRVQTTLAKAKAARSMAERMVTLGKRGTIHHRRLVAARLGGRHARTFHRTRAERQAWRQNEDVVRILFDEIAPTFKNRAGGYTRILKLGKRRRGDAAEQAILEWVEEGSGTGEAAPTEKGEGASTASSEGREPGDTASESREKE